MVCCHDGRVEKGLGERLARIESRLAHLRELDVPRPGASNFVDDDDRRLPGYVMFGADLHRHENRAVPEHALQRLEAAMKCPLPEGFRGFLSRIGTGSGPYYGIPWSKLERCASPACAQAFPAGSSGPIYRDEDDDGIEHGYLVITDMGCGDEVAVITAGQSRGHVVFLLYNSAEWQLGPEFLDFYENWIERGIEGLSRQPHPRMIV